MIRRSDSALCSDLASYCFDVFLPTRLPLAAEATIKQYASALRQFASHLGRGPTLADLTDANLSALVRALRKAGKSVITINRGPLSRLLTLWRFAAQQKAVERWPVIRSLEEPQVVPDAWRLHELDRLVAACDKMPGTVGTIPACDWWRAIVLTAIYTGERTGALHLIPHDALSIDERTLTVAAQYRKGRRKPAVYRDLPDVVIEALRKIALPKRARLFGRVMSEATFYLHYGKLLGLAGLPVGRRNKLQKLRRTFATLLHAAGGDARKALGHSDGRVTERSYLDPTQDTGPAPASLLPRIGGAKT